MCQNMLIVFIVCISFGAWSLKQQQRCENHDKTQITSWASGALENGETEIVPKDCWSSLKDWLIDWLTDWMIAAVRRSWSSRGSHVPLERVPAHRDVQPGQHRVLRDAAAGRYQHAPHRPRRLYNFANLEFPQQVMATEKGVGFLVAWQSLSCRWVFWELIWLRACRTPGLRAFSGWEPRRLTRLSHRWVRSAAGTHEKTFDVGEIGALFKGIFSTICSLSFQHAATKKLLYETLLPYMAGSLQILENWRYWIGIKDGVRRRNHLTVRKATFCCFIITWKLIVLRIFGKEVMSSISHPNLSSSSHVFTWVAGGATRRRRDDQDANAALLHEADRQLRKNPGSVLRSCHTSSCVVRLTEIRSTSWLGTLSILSEARNVTVFAGQWCCGGQTGVRPALSACHPPGWRPLRLCDAKQLQAGLPAFPPGVRWEVHQPSLWGVRSLEY